MDAATYENIMTAVCDLCHYPYVETDQEALEERCEVCPVEKLLKELV